MKLGAVLRALWIGGRGVIGGLPPEAANRDPIDLFGEWYRSAERSGLLLPEAMALATCGEDGRPTARMVLLKHFGPDGFVFYTNYGSRKARALASNPRAALVFHWASLQRQVIIEGSASRTSEEESRTYFRTRPRGSQIAAWASKQSQELSSRAELERRFHEAEARFRGTEVPLPPFWGGYRLVPERIEFWQGRANRLHDRLEFRRDTGGWRSAWLYP